MNNVRKLLEILRNIESTCKEKFFLKLINQKRSDRKKKKVSWYDI